MRNVQMGENTFKFTIAYFAESKITVEEGIFSVQQIACLLVLEYSAPNFLKRILFRIEYPFLSSFHVCYPLICIGTHKKVTLTLTANSLIVFLDLF